MRHTFIAFKTNMLLKYITIGMERRPNNIHQNVNILYQIFNGRRVLGVDLKAESGKK